jgi:hypothetical protein
MSACTDSEQIAALKAENAQQKANASLSSNAPSRK